MEYQQGQGAKELEDMAISDRVIGVLVWRHECAIVIKVTYQNVGGQIRPRVCGCRSVRRAE